MVGFSLHQMRIAASSGLGCEKAPRERLGTLAETFGVFLNLCGQRTALGTAGLCLRQQQETVVPRASSLLNVIEAGSQRGCGFRGVAGDFDDVTPCFTGLANCVELVIPVGIEVVGGVSDPVSCGVDQSCAAQVEINAGRKGCLYLVESLMEVIGIFAETVLQFLNGLLSGRAEVFFELDTVGLSFVSSKHLKVDIEIADLAGGAPDLSKRLTEGLGLRRQIG